MVQKIISIWAMVLALRMPPPGCSALLSEIVLLISLSVPPSLEMPPPVSARSPRDRAVDESQRCIRRVVDTATTRFSIITRDTAVDEDQRPSQIIVDAATIRVAARWCARCRGVSECCIARGRAVDQCKCPCIVQGTGRER